MSEPVPEQVEALITRWQASGASERANYQMFLSELCDVLAVPRPDPASEDADKNLYVFDRAITRVTPDGVASTNYIDFYKAGHFVWETRQGVSYLRVLASSRESFFMVVRTLVHAKARSDIAGLTDRAPHLLKPKSLKVKS